MNIRIALITLLSTSFLTTGFICGFGGNSTHSSQSDVGAPIKAPVGAIDISVELDEAGVVAAQELAALADPERGEFPYKELKAEKAELFMWLAANNPTPHVRQAALIALPAGWTKNPTYEKDKKPVDADYRAVVTALLDSPHDRVLAGALKASDLLVSVEQPDAVVVAKLYEHATTLPTGPGRMAALEAMRTVTDGAKSTPHIDAVLANLTHDDPLVVATALDCVAYLPSDLARPKDMRKTMKKLLDHSDPAVRGRAADRWAELVADQRKPKKNKEAGKRLAKMLKDAHPFVRAQAARSMEEVKYTAGIHDIKKHMLHDKAGNSISTPYTTLGSQRRNFISDASQWSRVDDAGLNAIAALSNPLKDDKFTLRKLRYGKVDEDIKAAVKEVNDWYDAHKGQF